MYTANNTVDMNPGNELKAYPLNQASTKFRSLMVNNNQGGVFKTILVK